MFEKLKAGKGKLNRWFLPAVLIGAAVCLLIACLLWNRQIEIDREKTLLNEQISELKEKENEEKEKAKEEEEKWNKAATDWKKDQNPETLKLLFEFENRKSEAVSLSDQYVNDLWSDPFINMDQLIQALEIRNNDPERLLELQLMKNLNAQKDQYLIFSNEVHLISRTGEKVTERSTVRMKPLLSESGLSFYIPPMFDSSNTALIQIPGSGPGIQGFDPDWDLSNQGLFDIRLIENTYPAVFEDGKITVTVDGGSAQSTVMDGLPIKMTISKDQMNFSYSLSSSGNEPDIHAGVLYLMDSDTFEKTVSDKENSSSKSETAAVKPAFEKYKALNGSLLHGAYVTGDLNNDQIDDLIIMDTASNPEFSYHPQILFYLNFPNSDSLTLAGSSNLWDGELLEAHSYHSFASIAGRQGVFKATFYSIENSRLKTSEMDVSNGERDGTVYLPPYLPVDWIEF